ncbi:MAG: amino acid permease [Candidatus Aenigmarchaeota archaeon]|nr:amino acid permease [Candidatus Aenigmarchaeota archaeon]
MKRHELKRELGLIDLTFYGIGIILGAGIYALIGPAAGMAGNGLWISFIIAAIIASFTGLSYAELSTMFPKEAAEYVYVKNAFNEFIAFLVGWIILVSSVVGAATLALGFAGYFVSVIGGNLLFVAIASIIILSFINFYGIKESAKLNILFTLIEASGLIMIIILGLPKITQVNVLELTHGVKGILTAAAFIFFAYIGFEDIANLAEEVKDPKKNVPLALLLSLGITTLLYVLVSVSVLGLSDWRELSSSEAPLAFAASKALGDIAFNVLGLIALFATSNTLLILLIVSSRMIYGMAREGSLPKFLGKIHPRRKTPHFAVLIVAVFSILLTFFQRLEFVANLTNFSVFLIFLMVNLSNIVLRYKKPNAKRPFRTPLNVGNFPLVSFFGLLSCGIMLSQFQKDVFIVGSVFLIIGALVYWIKNRFT